MRNTLTPLRPGLTAIAAVLALSTTPAFAQDAQTAPATDAPVISAPAPAITAAPAAAPAPIEQSVTSENTSAPVADAAPAAPMATQSTPVVHTTADTGKEMSAPIAKSTAPAKRAIAPVAASTVPAAAPERFTPAAPKVAEAAPAPAPAPAAVPAPVTVAKTSTTTTSSASNDNREIELAGIGAVGLIVLIGGAVALTRRKRSDEDEGLVTTASVAPAAYTAEPVAYETVSSAPMTVAAESVAIEGAPTTALHKDFDLSRYGPYVQQAYRGPTDDNPSLSLRHRLKRARFMDQRARENGETIATAEPIAAERRPVTQNLFGSKLKDGLRSLRPQPNMRPAFG